MLKIVSVPRVAFSTVVTEYNPKEKVVSVVSNEEHKLAILKKRFGEDLSFYLSPVPKPLKSALKKAPLSLAGIKTTERIPGLVLEPVFEVPSDKLDISTEFSEIYKACSYSTKFTQKSNHIHDLIDWSKRKVGLYTEKTIADHKKSAQVAIEKILNSKLFKHVPQDEKARFWVCIEAAIKTADVDV